MDPETGTKPGSLLGCHGRTLENVKEPGTWRIWENMERKLMRYGKKKKWMRYGIMIRIWALVKPSNSFHIRDGKPVKTGDPPPLFSRDRAGVFEPPLNPLLQPPSKTPIPPSGYEQSCQLRSVFYSPHLPEVAPTIGSLTEPARKVGFPKRYEVFN